MEVIIKNAEAGDGVTDRIHKIRVVDQVKPLELLAKHFGLSAAAAKKKFTYHFKTKDQFLRQLLDGIYEEMFTQLSSGLGQSGPPLHRLREALGKVHGIDPARIICGTGSGELLAVAASAFAGTSARRILVRDVTDFAFRRYKVVNGVDYTAANDLETKQLQITLRAVRSRSTTVDATNAVLSARVVLRNKVVST